MIGYGMPTAGTRKAHSDAPGEEAVRETKRHLGWPEDKQFYVPDEALAHFREAVERGAKQEAEWNALVEKYQREACRAWARCGSSMMKRRTARGLGRRICRRSQMRSRWRRAWRAAK